MDFSHLSLSVLCQFTQFRQNALKPGLSLRENFFNTNYFKAGYIRQEKRAQCLTFHHELFVPITGKERKAMINA